MRNQHARPSGIEDDSRKTSPVAAVDVRRSGVAAPVGGAAAAPAALDLRQSVRPAAVPVLADPDVHRRSRNEPRVTTGYRSPAAGSDRAATTVTASAADRLDVHLPNTVRNPQRHTVNASGRRHCAGTVGIRAGDRLLGLDALRRQLRRCHSRTREDRQPARGGTHRRGHTETPHLRHRPHTLTLPGRAPAL
ncbi:hypothetical protein OPAG_02270 [Rhodococcus opacus PD630]|nr:hypothetical protein OPAG_02270 [Rhodococcus opacus PD630]